MTARLGRRLGHVSAMAALMLATACATTTPRDGTDVLGAGQLSEQAGEQLAGQEGATDPGSVPGDPASPGAPGEVAAGPGSTASTGTSGGTSPGAATGGGSNTAPGAPSQGQGATAPRATARGVTAKTIRVSVIAGFSGAYGTVINGVYEEGFGTWLADINARGGIHGRKVELVKLDHAETTAGGVNACKQAQSNNTFLAFVAEGQGDGNFAASDCLDKAGVINLAFQGAPSTSWRNTYGWISSGQAQGKALASYVKQGLGDGGKKLGVIYLSPPSYAATQQAYVAEAKKLGMNVVASEQVQPNQSSFVSELSRLRNAGAENVAIIATTEAIGILRDARSLGFSPRWVGAVWCFDFITQAARDLAKDAHCLRYSAAVNSPKFAEFRAKANKYGKGSATNGEALIYYGAAQLLEKTLDAAGKQPTAATLRTGLESINNYDNGILPPITYTATNRNGPTASFPAVCCDGNYAWRGTGPARSAF